MQRVDWLPPDPSLAREPTPAMARAAFGFLSEGTAGLPWPRHGHVLPDWLRPEDAVFSDAASWQPSGAEPGALAIAGTGEDSRPRPGEEATIDSLPVLVLGLAGGLLGGLLLAWARMRGDGGFASAEALTAATGLRCPGTLPRLPRRAVAALARDEAGTRHRAALDAAAKGICAVLGLSRTGPEGRVVLVTSALPGEGKSFLCQALAEALVAAGQRVLLVDAEARCPPHLAAEKDIDPGAGRGLVVVRDRPPFGGAADILRIGSFAQFLDDARLHFDTVLLAGAPLLHSADSLILARMSDVVLPVVRCAATPRPLVDAALNRLKEDSIMVDGVVLNGVRPRRGAAPQGGGRAATPSRPRARPRRARRRPGQPSSRSQ